MLNAWDFARVSAGNSSAARMAMMAITTSNSINVNARAIWFFLRWAPRAAVARQPANRSFRARRPRPGKDLSLVFIMGFFIGMLVFRQPPAGRRRIAFGLPVIRHGELTR